MKKLVSVVLLIFVMSTFSTVLASAQSKANIIELDRIESGVFGVYYDGDANGVILVEKDEERYQYHTTKSKDIQYFPLQMGDGSYQISVLEQVDDRRYRVLHRSSIDVIIEDESEMYLTSYTSIPWMLAEEATKLAAELVEDIESDEEKVKAIYDYVIQNIRYDYQLAASVQVGYVPDIDETLIAGKGICFEYSTLFAAMLRSVDIPTKLLMGSTDYVKGYHAWNEVLVGDDWITIDTTIDHTYAANKLKFDWKKDASQYNVEKVY